MLELEIRVGARTQVRTHACARICTQTHAHKLDGVLGATRIQMHYANLEVDADDRNEQ